jgi:hypothetical protein
LGGYLRLFQRDLLGEERINIIEMSVAMQRAIHTELCLGGLGMFLHLPHKVSGKRLEFGIHSFCGDQAKIDGSAGLQSMTDHF